MAKYQIFVSGPKVGTSKPFVIAMNNMLIEDGTGTQVLFDTRNLEKGKHVVVSLIAKTATKKFYNFDKSEYYEPHAWVEVEIE